MAEDLLGGGVKMLAGAGESDFKTACSYDGAGC